MSWKNEKEFRKADGRSERGRFRLFGVASPANFNRGVGLEKRRGHDRRKNFWGCAKIEDGMTRQRPKEASHQREAASTLSS